MTTKTMLATFLLMTATMASAQEVALLDPHPRTATRTSRSADGERPSPITDDGHDADRLVPAAQLLIASTAEAAGSVELEVRDEHGHLVEKHIYAASRTIAVDLGHLKRGRYVAKVMREGRVEVCRFTRP